ncbi:MAG: DUF523 domain-containing protein [Clostridium perfringens]|nr:DUF523 domain-containing protein [Clostridium perfringens]
MILVSACLLGVNCKYNGGNNKNGRVIEFLKGKKFIMVCPEELGGLTTPRIPSEIIDTARDVINGKGKILNKSGDNVTEKFLKGAYETLKIVKDKGIKVAILKAKSPSCGSGLVYDGTFSNKLILGNGVTAEMLKDNKIEVITEEDISIGHNFI